MLHCSNSDLIVRPRDTLSTTKTTISCPPLASALSSLKTQPFAAFTRESWGYAAIECPVDSLSLNVPSMKKLVFALLSLVGVCLARQRPTHPENDTRVILLGTGTPNPEPEHSGPAVAIVTGQNVYIVDAGPGVVRRAAQAGISMDQLTRAFITHLHSDHTVGLPDLIFTPAVTGRQEALEIYGPPGLSAMTSHILEAWTEDTNIRLHGLEPAVKQAYVVNAHDVQQPGEFYRDTAAGISAIPVNHGAWKYAWAYRFDVAGKVIIVSGDTTYSLRLQEAARDCDILVHEFYSQKGWEARTPEWQRYHAAYHTSAIDVGKLAAAANVKKLVLYHELPMGQAPDEVIQEVRQHYSGEIIYGKDLDIIR
jgi:ribonuclease Z